MPRQDRMWKRFMEVFAWEWKQGEGRVWEGLRPSGRSNLVQEGREVVRKFLDRRVVVDLMTRTGLAVSPARPSTGKGDPDASVHGFIGHLYPLHQGSWEAISLVPQLGPPTPKSRMRVDTLYCSATVNFGPNVQSEYAKLCMRQPLSSHFHTYYTVFPFLESTSVCIRTRTSKINIMLFFHQNR